MGIPTVVWIAEASEVTIEVDSTIIFSDGIQQHDLDLLACNLAGVRLQPAGRNLLHSEPPDQAYSILLQSPLLPGSSTFRKALQARLSAPLQANKSMLLNLPNELLEIILDFVPPNDIDNFLLSCRQLRALPRRFFSDRHLLCKYYLPRIHNDPNRHSPSFRVQEMLALFLLAPSRSRQYDPGLVWAFGPTMCTIGRIGADYVREMAIEGWKVCWDDASREDEGERRSFFDSLRGIDSHRPYPDSWMRLFEEVVKVTESIPSKEKEHWMSKINAGDQNPVFALLLPQLHHLNYLVINLDEREDFFIRKALQHIVRDPRSPSLSRLIEVEIFGSSEPTHREEMATACAALPAIITLRVHGLVEGPPEPAESRLTLAPHSSSIQDLTLHDCDFSANALFNLIRSAKSLRSLTYSYSSDGTHRSFAWVRAALLQYASMTLEELTLHRSHYTPDWKRTGCSFKSYRKLRVLTIDYTLLMGAEFQTTDKMVNLLPKSLEILNLYGYNSWNFKRFQDIVKWVVRVKQRLVPCLKEMNFVETSHVDYHTTSQVKRLCAAAGEAGITMTIDPDREHMGSDEEE